MKKFNYRIGVDVSKLTLDLHSAEHQKHLKIDNNAEGLKAFTKWLKELQIPLNDVLIVMEYTGGCEFRLVQFCEAKNIAYTRISGLAIKKSMGIVRGKNDKVDAFRIAQYADEKQKVLQPSKPLNKSIVSLKELLALRKRLVRENAGYKSTIKGRKDMYDLNNKDLHIKILKQKIDANLKHIEVVEKEIDNLIMFDEAIARNYMLLKSVRGIGKINAAMTIAYTENFEAFSNARSYAVYVGVVPFEYSSGTSINGRKRISQIGNKELKQELNQAAKSAIQWDEETKQYANRLIEKKHYRIVLNNVKFKLITRMFAVVKKGELYVDNYKKVA
jgi:transposase